MRDKTEFSKEISEVLIRHAPEGIALLNPEGKIMAVNDSFLKMSGRKREELLGQSLAAIDALPEHFIKSHDLQSILLNKPAGPTETLIRKGRGQFTYIEYVAVPIFKSGRKRPEGTAIFMRDIRKRVKLHQALEKHAENLKRRVEKRTMILWRQMAENGAVLGSMGEGVVAVDKDIRVTILNRQAARMIGLEAKRFIGKHADNIPQLCHEDGRILPDREKPFETALSTGKTSATAPGDSYIFQTRADGTKFPVGIITTPVRLGRKIIGAVSVFRDVTLGRQLDQAKKQFVALASHQLRTPLSISSWYLEKILAERSLDHDSVLAQDLATVYQANRRMVSLVDDLLHTSRIEMGSFVLNPVQVPLAEVIERSHLELLPAVSRKHLSVTKEYARPDIAVSVDPRALDIVWSNLFENACNYTPEGGHIAIAVRENLSEVILELSDDGIGIPAHQQGRIFSKLFRADNVLDKSTNGNGLGLYIAKSIIVQSGGKIRFESEENKGTTFYVSLPK